MMTAPFDLTRVPLFKRLLATRWFPWLGMTLTLPLFLLAILTGLFGTPAGSRNFGIIFVWIVWWAALILVLVPLAGRLWCGICPIPAPGEWLQRRALVQQRAGGKLYTLSRKFPRRLKNIWFQNASFLALALFSVVILTTPFVSALVLLLFVVVALAASILFERRVFCRYLCPVSGFIGLYSQLAPVELRVRDAGICKTHTVKTCYQGSADGYGCPWLVYPAALDKNTNCGLCTECLKTCPHDNIGIFLRVPGKDLQTTQGRRLDEAYKAFIMLTCALAYSVVLMGPWASLKEAAYAVASPAWWVYAFGFLAANLALVPGLFFACTALARQLSFGKFSFKRTFVEYSYALVPLGLAAWVAFSVSFVPVNASYAWQVLSDPFGWGWDLLGTAAVSWTPYLAGQTALLQIPILLSALVWATAVALGTAQSQSVPRRAALPVISFCAAFTVLLLWLYS
jgi:polyferredoxin